MIGSRDDLFSVFRILDGGHSRLSFNSGIPPLPGRKVPRIRSVLLSSVHDQFLSLTPPVMSWVFGLLVSVGPVTKSPVSSYSVMFVFWSYFDS